MESNQQHQGKASSDTTAKDSNNLAQQSATPIQTTSLLVSATQEQEAWSR